MPDTGDSQLSSHGLSTLEEVISKPQHAGVMIMRKIPGLMERACGSPLR
jgi:hypothetical protein